MAQCLTLTFNPTSNTSHDACVRMGRIVNEKGSTQPHKQQDTLSMKGLKNPYHESDTLDEWIDCHQDVLHWQTLLPSLFYPYIYRCFVSQTLFALKRAQYMNRTCVSTASRRMTRTEINNDSTLHSQTDEHTNRHRWMQKRKREKGIDKESTDEKCTDIKLQLVMASEADRSWRLLQ